MGSQIKKLWAVCRYKVDTLKILFQFFHHNNGCLLTIQSYKSYHHHSARQKSVFPVLMRSCLTNGVTVTTFPYLGACKNSSNIGCHTKLNARENRVMRRFILKQVLWLLSSLFCGNDILSDKWGDADTFFILTSMQKWVKFMVSH